MSAIDELRAMIDDASATPNGAAATAPHSDLGNAERFALEHAHRLRHVAQRGDWLVWAGHAWAKDDTGEAQRAAKATARNLLTEATLVDDDKARVAAGRWALTTQAEPRLRAMLTVASTELGCVVSASDLDTDPMLLACPNGTVDLSTGSLRPAEASDLITRSTPIRYDPDSRCPRWERMLNEIFDGDQDLIGFLRRWIGYGLTGDTREHVLAVLHGAGCNGKSTVVEVVKKLAGELVATAAFDTFARTKGSGGPRNDLARLAGARIVVASESGEGRRLDEATVKEITGGDTIAARFLYAEHFEFRPAFKLWLVTNHRPRVDGDDDAIWRRLRLIPFNVSFEGREDRTLGAQLDAELPGILAWAVQGCLEWQQHGLGTAGAVESATRAYRQDEDVLGAFLDERCAASGEVAAAELRAAYEEFCGEIGERPLGGRLLGRRLAKRGITAARRAKGVRVYVGVQLAQDATGDMSAMSDMRFHKTPRVRAYGEDYGTHDTHGTHVTQGSNGHVDAENSANGANTCPDCRAVLTSIDGQSVCVDCARMAEAG